MAAIGDRDDSQCYKQASDQIKNVKGGESLAAALIAISKDLQETKKTKAGPKSKSGKKK